MSSNEAAVLRTYEGNLAYRALRVCEWPRRTTTPDFDYISLDQYADGEGVVGAKAGLREVLDLLRTVAPTGATVLVEGEAGTGKEVIAQAIHTYSRRRDRPSV